MKNSLPRRGKAALTASRLRSAITNGKNLLADVDHRSAWMRRLKDLVGDATSDLGGADLLSNAERVLVRRAAMLTLQAEMMESRWNGTDGEAPAKEIETYQRITNTLRRTLKDLGLQRRPRPITPDYSDMARRAREAHPA
jgi:hypothetical protein